MEDDNDNIYAERDTESLGNLYFRHIDRMTRENLREKSAIAAELAFRDAEIERLQAIVDANRWRQVKDERPPEHVQARVIFGNRAQVVRQHREGCWIYETDSAVVYDKGVDWSDWWQSLTIPPALAAAKEAHDAH